MGAGWRTLAYTLMVVTLEFALGLGMALLFTTLGRKSEIWRTVFLYPLMIAPIVAGLLWKFLMIDNFGLIGTLLHQAGILQNPNQIGWLSNPDIVLFSVAVPDIWLTTSFMCLVLFAGLQNIPGDLIEAARLDGARAHTLLFRIILPLLRPVIAVALVVRGIDAARAFDTILIQTNGGPQSASETTEPADLPDHDPVRRPGPGERDGHDLPPLDARHRLLRDASIWRPGKTPDEHRQNTPSRRRNHQRKRRPGVAYRPRPAPSCTRTPARTTARRFPNPRRQWPAPPSAPRRRPRDGQAKPQDAAVDPPGGIHGALRFSVPVPAAHVLQDPDRRHRRAALRPAPRNGRSRTTSPPWTQRGSGLVHQQHADRDDQHGLLAGPRRPRGLRLSPATGPRAAGCSSSRPWSPGWCPRWPSAFRSPRGWRRWGLADTSLALVDRPHHHLAPALDLADGELLRGCPRGPRGGGEVDGTLAWVPSGGWSSRWSRWPRGDGHLRVPGVLERVPVLAAA